VCRCVRSIGAVLISTSVSLKLDSGLAQKLRVGGDIDAALRGVIDAFLELEVWPEPMGGQGAATPLHPYFVLHLEDPEAANRAIQRLLQCEGVDAAFVKPQGEPPG
jgi:hypothetical protein